MGWLASDGGGIDWQPRLHAISEQTELTQFNVGERFAGRDSSTIHATGIAVVTRRYRVVDQQSSADTIDLIYIPPIQKQLVIS